MPLLQGEGPGREGGGGGRADERGVGVSKVGTGGPICEKDSQ